MLERFTRKNHDGHVRVYVETLDKLEKLEPILAPEDETETEAENDPNQSED